MTRYAILLDGDMTPTPRLRQQLDGCRVIAADGGIRHAAALDLTPELWLGDFDSVPDPRPAGVDNVPRADFPREKDATDGEIAVHRALENGASDLILVGAFGGRRADHALLHKTKALDLAKRGIAVMLSDGKQEGVPVLAGEYRFDLAVGTTFSLVGFSDLDGLSISGVKWPLNTVHVPLGSSWTMSNEIIGELTIELGSGRALLIAQVSL